MHVASGPIVHRLTQVASTQRVARDYIELGAARAGHVIVADEQTDGVGRRGRAWVSPRGGLYASFVVPNDRLVSVRAGVAAARAIEALAVPIRLKWPNDLVVDGAKLGGIVIDTVKSLAIVGMGINLDGRPVEGSACLRDAGVVADRFELVRTIYAGLVTPVESDELLGDYRRRLSTLGRHVRVEQDNGVATVGQAVDVDSDGHLIIATAEGLASVTSGDCVHLRAHSPASRTV